MKQHTADISMWALWTLFNEQIISRGLWLITFPSVIFIAGKSWTEIL